ncbi:MAG: hypothetical protein ACRDV7_01030 [Acidimicrobiia bacterium]
MSALAAIGFAVLALTGCAGDDDDTGSVEDEIREAVDEGNLDEAQEQLEDLGGETSELPDACELVTVEDATGLFGTDAEEQPDASPVGLGASCIYETPETEDLGTVGHLLQVRVFDGEQFFGAETYDDEEEIDDLGDRAFVRSNGSALTGVEVQFVQDGKTVSLNYSTINIGVDEADQVNSADHEDEVVELARQASGRM